MKKALLAALAAAAIFAATASADAPQGKLTGGTPGVIVIPGAPVIDGGTTFVGEGNDFSGNCSGDTGSVLFIVAPLPVVCAHFVASSGASNSGSPKMRFALALLPGGPYAIFRITDNAPATDSAFVAFVVTLSEATAWVNTGPVGSGIPGAFWAGFGVLGDFTVTAAQ